MKTKILFVLTRPPYPATDGTRERILNEITDLAKDFELDLLIIGNEGVDEKQAKHLNSLGIGRITCFKTAKIESYLHSLMAIFSSKPLQASYFFNSEALSWLNQNISDYQTVHFHTIRFGRYISWLKRHHHQLPRLLLCFNDAISLNYADAAKKAKGFWKHIYRLETKRVLAYEIAMLSLADGFSIVSERDKQYLLSAWTKESDGGSEPAITVIRHGINDDLFRYDYSPTSKDLVFIGNLLYPPNRQGLEYFCNHILPLVNRKQPTKLFIIGRGSKEYFSSVRDCQPLGFVDDPYPLLTSQALFISPADFGAGVPTKTLLAMALGLPVVSTQNNAKGIEGVSDRENIILIDYEDDEKAADIIVAALNDEEARRRIGQSGKRLASNRHRQSDNYPLLKAFIEGKQKTG